MSGQEIVSRPRPNAHQPMNMGPCWTAPLPFCSFPVAFLTSAFAYRHKFGIAHWRNISVSFRHSNVAPVPSPILSCYYHRLSMSFRPFASLFVRRFTENSRCFVTSKRRFWGCNSQAQQTYSSHNWLCSLEGSSPTLRFDDLTRSATGSSYIVGTRQRI